MSINWQIREKAVRGSRWIVAERFAIFELYIRILITCLQPQSASARLLLRVDGQVVERRPADGVHLHRPSEPVDGLFS